MIVVEGRLEQKCRKWRLIWCKLSTTNVGQVIISGIIQIYFFLFFLYNYLFVNLMQTYHHSAEWSTSNVITQVSQLSAEFSLFIIGISRYSSFDWIANSAINDSYLRNQYIVFHAIVNTRRDRCDERAAILINSKLRQTNKLVRSTPLIWRQNVQMKGNRCHIKSTLNFQL